MVFVSITSPKAVTPTMTVSVRRITTSCIVREIGGTIGLVMTVVMGRNVITT